MGGHLLDNLTILTPCSVHLFKPLLKICFVGLNVWAIIKDDKLAASANVYIQIKSVLS